MYLARYRRTRKKKQKFSRKLSLYGSYQNFIRFNININAKRRTHNKGLIVQSTKSVISQNGHGVVHLYLSVGKNVTFLCCHLCFESILECF